MSNKILYCFLAMHLQWDAYLLVHYCFVGIQIWNSTAKG